MKMGLEHVKILVALCLVISASRRAFLVSSLVVTTPCCHVFQHRGAMFGPALPVPTSDTTADAIFHYLPDIDRPTVASVEGPLKLTSESNPSLCRPERVVHQDYLFDNMIALIPRGGCSFAEKVYFAQLLGAKAAIVFQAQDASGSHSNANSNGGGFIPLTGNDDVIVMAEDSRYGNLVEIPSAFISYNSWTHIATLIREIYASTDNASQELLDPVAEEEAPTEEEAYLYDLSDIEPGFNRVLSEVSSTDLATSVAERPKMVVSDEIRVNRTTVTVDYEAEYAERMKTRTRKTSEEETVDPHFDQAVLKELAGVRRILEADNIYVVLNETGSLAITGPDALPMMWDSMVFLIKVFVIIWSVMGFAYASNWIKARYRRLRRQHVIKSLPCKKYRKLQIHSNSVSLKNEEKPAPKKRKKKYEKVSSSDIDLERNESGSGFDSQGEKETDELLGDDEDEEKNSTAGSITLEEYNPNQVQRQNSDLKLRSSPRKQRKDESSSNSNSGSSAGLNQSFTSFGEAEFIECDSCVICLCEFELEDFVTVLPCKHIYHKDCIEPWLINKSSLCPMCKQSIFKNGESRSINEINQSELEQGDFGAELTNEEEQRRGSIALSVGMILVIILSFTFIMVDDDH